MAVNIVIGDDFVEDTAPKSSDVDGGMSRIRPQTADQNEKINWGENERKCINVRPCMAKSADASSGNMFPLRNTDGGVFASSGVFSQWVQ